jgi:hypothetical protein
LHHAKHDVNGAPPPTAGKYQMQEGRRFVRVDSTPTRINALAFSRMESCWLQVNITGRLVLWDVASKRVFCTIDTGFTRVGLVAISSDDRFIAALKLSGMALRFGRFRMASWSIPSLREMG